MLSVHMSVHIDGVFVKCYSIISDCNVILFSLLISTLTPKGDLEGEKMFYFVCFVLSLLETENLCSRFWFLSFVQPPQDGALQPTIGFFAPAIFCAAAGLFMQPLPHLS